MTSFARRLRSVKHGTRTRWYGHAMAHRRYELWSSAEEKPKACPNTTRFHDEKCSCFVVWTHIVLEPTPCKVIQARCLNYFAWSWFKNNMCSINCESFCYIVVILIMVGACVVCIVVHQHYRLFVWMYSDCTCKLFVLLCVHMVVYQLVLSSDWAEVMCVWVGFISCLCMVVYGQYALFVNAQ